MGGHRDRVSPPTRALPTHQSHRTYDLGRPAEGGSRRRRPRGLGLRCRRLLKFAPGRWSPKNWKSGQRGREPEPSGQGGARTLDRGRAESVEGAGRRRERGLAVTATRSLRPSPRVWEKFLGWIAAGTPLSARPPARRHPRSSSLASRSMPALPRPAGRARRGADYISPGLAGRVFPEPPRPEWGAGAASGAPPPASPPREGDLLS